MSQQPPKIIFATSSAETMPSTDSSDRRFTVYDSVKLLNAHQHAEHLRAHADFLTERQRASGIRARLCSTGCYSLYDAQGHYIGRTAPPHSLCTLGESKLKTAAARMAYSEELFGMCRDADGDYEATGTVSAATITNIRALLSVMGDA